MCACLRDKALLASKHLQKQGFSTIKLRHLGVTACIVHCYSIVEPFSFDILLAFAILGFGLTWKKFEAEQSAIFSNKSLPFKPAKFIQSNLKKDHCKKETKFQSLFFLFSRCLSFSVYMMWFPERVARVPVSLWGFGG